ncbi:hypothetical protein FMN50_01455 [Rhodobacterales bacterium]|nr:hypothetical protein FMN50_01455 [Rhodobacterales bacterium]
MTRLQRFSGEQTLPGVRRPQVVADTSSGQAVEGFGSRVSASAAKVGELAELAQKRQKKLDDHLADEASRNVQKFSSLKVEEERKARPGSHKLTEAMMAHLEMGRKGALERLPIAARERFEKKWAVDAERFRDTFAAVEHADGQAYYESDIRKRLEEAAEDIRSDPGRLEDHAVGLHELIQSLPLESDRRERLRHTVGDRLLEAWVEGQSLDVQIVGLSNLANVNEGDGSSSDRGDHNAAGTGVVKPLAASAFEQRARLLPRQTRNRLLASALQRKSAQSTAEERRLSKRIEENPLAQEPAEILESGGLEWHQKARLLDTVSSKVRELEANLQAVDWARSNDLDGAGDVSRAVLAERAYAYLNDGKTDRDALALGLLRSKGELPASYVSSLRNRLTGGDRDEISSVMKSLSAIVELDPDALLLSQDHAALREDAHLWRTLTERLGLADADAAGLIANARQPVTRKDLESELARRATELSGRLAPDSILKRSASAIYGPGKRSPENR